MEKYNLQLSNADNEIYILHSISYNLNDFTEIDKVLST